MNKLAAFWVLRTGGSEQRVENIIKNTKNINNDNGTLTSKKRIENKWLTAKALKQSAKE